MSELPNPSKPILLVDDELNLLNSFDLTLNENGIDNTILCNDSREVMTILSETQVSLVLLDLSMPHIRGEVILEQIIEQFPETAVIIVTGDTEVETAIHCMKIGASDYLIKPIENNRLLTTVEKVLEIEKLKEENYSLKKRIITKKLDHPEAFREIVTQNSKMNSMFQYIEAISKTSEPIMITGETGVGKELIARSIHQVSERKGAFITTNIAGLDDQMFSDTLFGHKKGSFTNATEDRKGQLEKASGGTIFLDEIGDLNLQSQVKLLRLLQEREYYPLGSDDPRFTNALFVLATNKDLSKMVEEGNFRKDLFYRLNVHRISPIPLRERLDDLPVLVDYFLEKAAENFGKAKPTVPNEIYSLLSTYKFPGNVRELQSMIFDAVGIHKSKVMSLASFKNHIVPNQLNEKPKPLIKIREGIRFGEKLPTLKEAQNALVQEALKRTNNNQSIAAKLLGVTRQALNRRVLLDKKSA